MYPYHAVHRAAIQNRGSAWSWDSEQYGVDWERGTLQSRSLIQDREILQHLTKISRKS